MTICIHLNYCSCKPLAERKQKVTGTSSQRKNQKQNKLGKERQSPQTTSLADQRKSLPSHWFWRCDKRWFQFLGIVFLATIKQQIIKPIAPMAVVAGRSLTKLFAEVKQRVRQRSGWIIGDSKIGSMISKPCKRLSAVLKRPFRHFSIMQLDWRLFVSGKSLLSGQ